MAKPTHDGPHVQRVEHLLAQDCAGSHDDCSNAEVVGYFIIDRADARQQLPVCRKCAVKLALKILELEVA